jgi:hypothetical protein
VNNGLLLVFRMGQKHCCRIPHYRLPLFKFAIPQSVRKAISLSCDL